MTHPIIEYLRHAPATYHPGWGAPEYSEWQDEQMSWKTTCYLGDAGETVGISSVPGYSYYFRKVLTLAYIAPAYAQPGTRVHVLWGKPGTRQKLIGATVAPAPYKTDNRRADTAALAVSR